ncbi:hypothetical protein [Candidatus Xianfuyuplasma coldseepsis]|uniref:Uncharacterized protein n=1 Tax=Candidatus Xianfuyuplasma coldseepsis TaxID=2782163 RepID=A0A7L7KUS1_9MOLU|nr:hypothetical protein [Xianfuyuplasma coldseepsis]QMS85744.1 hypothetical protein G4Z02_08305 [Xianfuyuplasma coldseepsis]
MKKLMKAPLDIKIFVCSAFLILGIFLLPDEPDPYHLSETYIVFVFVYIVVSVFFARFIGDSDYNILRKAKTPKAIIITLLLYVLICGFIAYVLASTELFLFFLP